MKYIKLLVALAVIIAVSGWLIGGYLGPDDLRQCTDLRPSSRTGCGGADVIVAISGGNTNARTDEAIRLFRNGWAPHIIFSGAAADKSGPSNAVAMKQRAVAAGIDPTAITVEEYSESTDQNALQTTSIATTRGYTQVILVTSPYHQRRAQLEFERRAPELIVHSHPTTTDNQWSVWWWLTPGGWLVALPELAGSLILSTGGVTRG
jgi:uncharacterized SAM-binding protein YcdF (DUF218 family)